MFNIVLSLFDGCSCGRVALDRAGIGWTIDAIVHIFSYLKQEEFVFDKQLFQLDMFGFCQIRSGV